jgi:hypothetical protein
VSADADHRSLFLAIYFLGFDVFQRSAGQYRFRLGRYGITSSIGILVSLFTQPKPDAELRGLVWGLTGRKVGVEDAWHRILERQARVWEDIHPDLPQQAQYPVGFAWKVRYSMQLNARAAMQMLELRTTPQGHPAYRRVAQQMHRLIASAHPAVAQLMTFVDHGAAELERLDAEQAAEARRSARGAG